MSSQKQLLPIYLVVFFGFVGYALMITIYTPLLMHSKLAHHTIILGVLLCAYPLGQFIGSPVVGALSDHFGRKRILQITLMITAVMYVFIAMAVDHFHVQSLMVLCFFAGLCESNVTLAVSAIADNSDESNRRRLFGYINLAASAAYIVGPLLGAPLSNAHLVHWFSPMLPFITVSFLLLASTVLLQVMYHEDTKVHTEGSINYLQAFTNIANMVKPTRFRRLFFINFLLYIAIFGFFRSYPMYVVNAFNLGITRESYFIAWVSVPLICANLGLIGWVAKKLSPVKMVSWSAILAGIFMILITIPPGIHALWVTLFLAGGAMALCLPATYALVSFAAGEHEQGAVMGNNNAVSVAGEAVSGLLGGFLAAIFVKLSLIVLGGIAILVGVLITPCVTHKEKHPITPQ